jgi:hypothetical protein
MDSNQHDDESADRPDDPAVVAAAAGKTTRERSRKNQRQRQPSKRHNRGPPLDEEPVERPADDVLLGARRIAEHLASILGVPVDDTDVYYAHRMKKWPIGKYGALLIASKRRFARHAEKLTRGPTA